jgi:2-hydroxycyclohexanecarboxyl-CoA dehydrogenase
MELNLENKVAIITGGSSGLGRRTAELLVQEKVRVVIADQNESDIRERVLELQGKGGTAQGVTVDVRNYEECQGMVAAALKSLGRLDILINSAGVGEHGLFAESDPASWRRQIDVNLLGVMNCCRAACDAFVAQRSGRIVNLASEAGKVGEKRIVVYSATKGGVIAFTKALSLELGRFNINVNAVCPGVTKTPMTAYLTPEQERDWARHYPLGRLGVPDDIAPMIVFLSSERASWITGQAISINGGFGRS